MNTFVRPALAAVALLVLAGCASSSGQPWTPPPAGTPVAETPAAETPVPTQVPVASEPPASEPPASEPPATPASSAAPTTGAPSAAPSTSASEMPGEARVIELEMDAALQIKRDGQKVVDIPVTPGETVVFRITNTAGYVHNFWIGTDQQLMTNQTQGLVGLADWTDAEPRDIVWEVPADITGVKYGCTVPGHYMLMQGVFSVAE